MIIWLASYPKSGNTWVRSFLHSLLFTKDGNADLNGIGKIGQYPLRSHFKGLTDNIDDIKKLATCWASSQSKINLDNKIKLILLGSISLLLLQTFIHIGVNIRILPTTGMTLPFLSYGGSSIISTAILSGIILNFTKRKINLL